jgi:hypothetical protein
VKGKQESNLLLSIFIFTFRYLCPVTMRFMRKKLLILLLVIFSIACTDNRVKAQCSVCTRTAQQLGEKPARGLNAGILYLALAPLAIIGVLTYRWWNGGNRGGDV